MRRCAWVLPVLWVGVWTAGPAQGGPGAAPDATHVVVRGKKDLGDALDAALHPLLEKRPDRPVLFVVDVSPNVKEKLASFAGALRSLDARYPHVGSWRLASLGATSAAEGTKASDLAPALPERLQAETPVVSTLDALARTIKKAGERASAVVYVNDWRFEDEADLEGFLRGLQRGGDALSVVGTEAAFERGWNDGFVPIEEQALDNPKGFSEQQYQKGVGRSPFGRPDHDAPWHGGDTAYPHMPYRWQTYLWQFEFTEFDFTDAEGDGEPDLAGLLGGDGKPPDYEELKKRLKGLEGKDGPDPLPGKPEPPRDDANRKFPLPAAYGPYGLMRVAGVTGGRYVLWSWNPGGRRQVHYEYSRCNMFPPDLRPRRDILRALHGDALAAALLRAWCALEAASGKVLQHTAPLKSNLRTPRSIDAFPFGKGGTLALTWEHKGEWRQFQREAGSALEALDKAAKLLDGALADTPAVPDDPLQRRLRADAELLRHVVRVARFEIAEGLAASKSLPRDAWTRADQTPGVIDKVWISAGYDPEKIRTQPMQHADPKAAAAVLAERKALLTRYRGTPFAEVVGLNDVAPLRLTWWQRGGEVPLSGHSPTESVGDPKPHLPGAPSTGGGPSTGR
jgi:hypothetical protein